MLLGEVVSLAGGIPRSHIGVFGFKSQLPPQLLLPIPVSYPCRPWEAAGALSSWVPPTHTGSWIRSCLPTLVQSSSSHLRHVGSDPVMGDSLSKTSFWKCEIRLGPRRAMSAYQERGPTTPQDSCCPGMADEPKEMIRSWEEMHDAC